MEPASIPLGTPVAEVTIDLALVATLLTDQHPDLAHLPLQAVNAGWDNAMFRLGDQLAVRLPRRTVAAPLIVNEQTWLPRLASRLALPVPTPTRIGTPGRGYPWCWSVLPWLAGMPADLYAPNATQVQPFMAFLRSLHVLAPPDAPANPVRGGRLRDRAPFTEQRMRRLADSTSLITPQLRQIWHAALDAPIDVSPTWLHGDLHPRNILVERGVISGVIDWGDITSGDCATDLAAIWMLFADQRDRQTALAAYAGLSQSTIQRAKGWAVMFGVVLLDSGLIDNPPHAAMGERTLRRLAEDV